MTRIRRRASIGAALLLGFAMVASLPAVAGPSLPMEEVKRLTSTMDFTRHLGIDVEARRLLEIGRVAGDTGMTVVSRDLDTHRRLKTVKIPGSLSGRSGYISAVDELRHRLYVVYPASPAALGPLADQATPVPMGIAALDTRNLSIVGNRVLPLLAPSQLDLSTGTRQQLKGITHYSDADEDKLYVLAEVAEGAGDPHSPANHAVILHELDIPTLFNESVAQPVWSVPVNQCAKAMARDHTTKFLRVRSGGAAQVYFPCRAGQVASRPQAGETPGMVRVRGERGPGGAPLFRVDFFPISGDFERGLTTVDRAGERFFLQAHGLSGETGVWVFDARTASWRGLISLPMTTVRTMAVDDRIGRLYTFWDRSRTETVAVAASTRTPVADQGRQLSFAGVQEWDSGHPVVDPIRRRIYAHETDGYKVIEDRMPPPPGDLGRDPDSNTVDMPEGPNTAVNFLGGLQAYGLRVRSVGGFGGLERNFHPFPDLATPFLGTGSLLPSEPQPGTREIHLARIKHATLTNDEASAGATGGERDDNTAADAGNWTTWLKRWGGPDFSGQAWFFDEVSCTDFGGPDDDRSNEAEGASVSCDRAKERAKADSFSETPLKGSRLIVGEARSSADIYRDAKRGIVSRAEAEVKGIQMTGEFGIGRIHSLAEAWATGRPKKSNKVGADSRHVVTIENVWVRNPLTGVKQHLCDDDCSVREVADTLNRVLSARMQFAFPQPDASRRGTSGGYEALIVRSVEEQINDASVNQETEIRLEVPAMVLTMFADGRVPSRLVMSFAGVGVESHYGIFPLPSDLPGLPSLPGTSVAPFVFEQPPSVPLDGIGPAPADSIGGIMGRLARKIVKGFSYALTSPVNALRAAGFWGFLAAPLIMMMRRRALGGAA